MWPETEHRVVFREEYRSLGRDAPQYFIHSRDETLATVFPVEHKRRRYPKAESLEQMQVLHAPLMETVPMARLRWAEGERHTPYLWALRTGKYRKAGWILDRDPLVDPAGDFSHPSPIMAQEISDPRLHGKTLDLLLRHGVDLDTPSLDTPKRGWTAMHAAMYSSRLDAAQQLLERGAGLGGKTEHDIDLMDAAIQCAQYNSMGWLILQGFTKPVATYLGKIAARRDTFDLSTYQSTISGARLPALHCIALGRFVKPEYFLAVMQALREQHVSFQQTDHNGLTALEAAQRHGCEAAKVGVEQLLADDHAKELHAHTPQAPARVARRAL